MLTRPILGAEHMRLSTFNTPSKRLMKERSSPGLRHHSIASALDSENDREEARGRKNSEAIKS